MKKIITLLCAATLCLGGVACKDPADNSTASSGNSVTYTVTFKQEGQEDVLFTVVEGGVVEAPDFVPKAGYSFAWDKNNFLDIRADMTVTAIATPNEYTITYQSGLENAIGYTIEGDTQEVTFDSEVTLYTPTATDKIFKGWVLEGTQTAFESGKYTVADDITLVGTWENPVKEWGDRVE